MKERKTKGGVSDMGATKSVEPASGAERGKFPHVNLRPFLFCAIGASFGVLLYARICFGGLVPSDFLFVGVLLFLALFPLSKKRLLILLATVIVFGGVTACGMHLYTQGFLSGKEEGRYEVEGTVSSFAAHGGYTTVELTHLTFNGEKVKGKLGASLPYDDVRPGDIVRFTAKVNRTPLPKDTDNYHFVNNLRYRSYPSEYEKVGRSKDPFLLLNGHIYNVLHKGMHTEEGNIAYALLTGNSRMVDSEFMSSVRVGGVAHIFAVSGLHIGILYGAVALIFRFLKKYAMLPALLFAIGYCALCGFSVSCVRAVLMCATLSVNNFFGRKNDLLSSLSLAAVIVLMFMPAQWLSVGFRLSFGACIGLSLFSGSFSRGLKRIHVPNFIGQYLSASVAVQLFTFPVMMEYFGYFSLWGLPLNLILVPMLPAAFLTLLLCTALSLIIPPAAGFFLIFPEGIFSLLFLFFTHIEFSRVLAGFTLGAGTVVWLTASVLLSERVRLGKAVRASCAGLAVLLFALCLIAENAVFVGCRVWVYEDEESMFALIRTPNTSVLILDGDCSLREIEDALLRRCPKGPDVAIILCEEGEKMLDTAAFTGAERVHLRSETPTGLQNTEVLFEECFSVDGLVFRYETAEKLVLFTGGVAVEFDFSGEASLDADFCVQKGSGDLNFFLGYGIIITL